MEIFFATVVVKMREELCPAEMKKRKEEAEKRQRIYNEKRKFNEKYLNDFWSRNFMGFLFANMTFSKVPHSELQQLNLTEETCKTEADVMSAYRKLALVHHPDKGGNQEQFVKITTAKNECLSWLSSKI